MIYSYNEQFYFYHQKNIEYKSYIKVIKLHCQFKSLIINYFIKINIWYTNGTPFFDFSLLFFFFFFFFFFLFFFFLFFLFFFFFSLFLFFFLFFFFRIISSHVFIKNTSDITFDYLQSISFFCCNIFLFGLIALNNVHFC